VHACYAATHVPIVGMGGVTNAQDVVDFTACGARHVALGTALFADPDVPRRVREELSVVSLDDVYAAAHTSARTSELSAKALA